MSHSHYNILWAEAQNEFRKLLHQEQNAELLELDNVNQEEETPEKKEEGEEEVKPKPKTPFFESVATLYIKYVSVFEKLDEVYDMMVHPQKRPLLRRLLDLIIGRILELKVVLVSTEQSEFHYFDGFPSLYDVDMGIPKYFAVAGQEASKRAMWVADLAEERRRDEEEAAELARMAEREAAGFARARFLPNVDMSGAILIVQTMERARQGRSRFNLAKIIAEAHKIEKAKGKWATRNFMNLDKAVVIIQKAIKGFLVRQRVNRMRERELEFLGLIRPKKDNCGPMQRIFTQKEIFESKIVNYRTERRKIQKRNEEEYERAKDLTESRLRLLETPGMSERMKFQLRDWMLQIKEKTGTLPDLPKKDMGGSRLIFCPESLPKEIQDRVREAESKERYKSPKKDKKEKKEKTKKEKKTIGDSELPIPAKLEEMVNFNKEYNQKWRGKDERHNSNQTFDQEMINEEKRRLVGEEVRDQVDEMMRSELDHLKQVLEGKKKKKGKKGKKGKRGKGKKGKKSKKKFKDLTPDRTLESLYGELFLQGIISQFPSVRLHHLVGDPSLINGTLRRVHGPELQEEKSSYPGTGNPLPTFGDVKRAVRDICILPLGSLTVRELAPYPKSVLLAGPRGSGKKSLVYAIATEVGATLFDLSATNIAGKYPGKPGLNMLVHLINKVSRLCQPSIVLMDEVEKMYAKKVPKTDKSDPKRLKKQIGRFLKLIGPEDQILLIGLTSEPWIAPIKPMKKDFNRIIYIPKPDYGTRMKFWQHILYDVDDLHPNVDFSILAKLSDGWTIGDIRESVERAVDKQLKSIEDQRVIEEKRRPPGDEDTNERQELKKYFSAKRKKLRLENFLEELSGNDPIFAEQEKTWNTWYFKTPMQRARMKTTGGSPTHEGPAKSKKGKKKK